MFPLMAVVHDALPAEEGWSNFVSGRYKEGKSEAEFRNYDATVVPTVAEFYKANHLRQTLDFVLAKEQEYFALGKGCMGIWEAAEFLNTLVDESDPDTDLTQIEHLLQTAEAIRLDGHPRWMVLTGFIHDLGKILCLYGEPQWAVVGDTFPVGCSYSDKIVFPDFFAGNADKGIAEYQTKYGIYQPNCGLKNVHMSWGHDAYIGHVVRNHMPEPALYMLRYHSFYAWHQQGAYEYLTSAEDRKMLEWVRLFNRYDLYSKGAAKPDVKALKPWYEDLIAEFFPAKLDW